MSKIRIDAKFNTPTEDFSFEGFGELKKGKILYNDKTINTKILFSETEIEIMRRSKEYDLDCMLILDKVTEGTYIINNAGTISLIITTKNLKIEEGLIEAEYSIENLGDFKFSINYEEI